MTKPTLTLVAFSVSGMLAAVLVAVLHIAPSQAASFDGVDDIREQLHACGNGVMTAQVLGSDEYQGCLYALMTHAADTGQLAELQDALSAELEQTPALANHCHDTGHRAGEYAFKLNPDIYTQLMDNSRVTCAYAIGHGLLDGFARSDPDRADFAAAATACNEWEDDRDSHVGGFCADGLGHAAWDVTNDLDAAVERCALLEHGHNQKACGEGIIMQIYQPAGFLAENELKGDLDTLPELCSSWPTPAGSEEVKVGCFTGAGYIYTRAAWTLAVAWSRDTDRAPLDSGIARQLRDALADAADRCGRHAQDEGELPCLRSVAWQIPEQVYDHPDLLSEVCALLGEHETTCREHVHVAA